MVEDLTGRLHNCTGGGDDCNAVHAVEMLVQGMNGGGDPSAAAGRLRETCRVERAYTWPLETYQPCSDAAAVHLSRRALE